MSRDITKLHPNLQEKIKLLQEKCNQAGLKIGIGECVRTVSEQNKLYAQGRTTPGTKVTNAKGSTYSSMHQWGVAVDFYRNDGKGAFNDSDGFFTKVGKIGQSIGLEWGGAWTSIKDKPHFQLADWGSTTAKLKAQYKNPTKFFATWSSVSVKKTNTSVSDYKYNGLDYSPVFNPVFYVGAYPDIKTANGAESDKLFNHFINFGMKERRIASSEFDIYVYMNNYADLREAFKDDYPKYYQHYITNGKAENRKAR